VNTNTDIQAIQIRVARGSLINYCYLVVNTDLNTAVVIDPAWDTTAIQKIITKFDADLLGVLVTHHHYDHMHLASYFAKRHNCRIYISEIESIYYGIADDRMTYFKDGENLFLGDIEILPIVTPGHTAGSSCFLVGDALFTGDTLFNEGCGLCHGNGADPVEMSRSLKKLKRIINDNVRIFPGHRYYSNLGLMFREVKNKNIYLQIENEDQFVKFRMRKAQKRLFSFF
jgi:glyoxylase-like metal-dependent hydrolase (beta-lactamase superfamily II)